MDGAQLWQAWSADGFRHATCGLQCVSCLYKCSAERAHVGGVWTAHSFSRSLTGLAFDDAIRSNLAPFGISSERRLAAYGMADDEEAAPTEVGLLLLRTAMTLPIHILVIVLHPLPAVELARLACVHNVFWRALLSLRQQHPGRRYAKPKESLLANARMWSRLSRAGYYGDVAVIQSIVAAGVDEHGTMQVRTWQADVSTA
jgi:hypothetical protein